MPAGSRKCSIQRAFCRKLGAQADTPSPDTSERAALASHRRLLAFWAMPNECSNSRTTINFECLLNVCAVIEPINVCTPAEPCDCVPQSHIAVQKSRLTKYSIGLPAGIAWSQMYSNTPKVLFMLVSCSAVLWPCQDKFSNAQIGVCKF